ncbi:MAG: LysR family transcriptional regulator [Lachnospiraceae bacterium]
MRTEYLEYLLEVNRAGSITAAAKNLYIRQTTLSTIINTVEKEINIKIFNRNRKGVQLTPNGEQALALVREIVRKNEELLTLFSANRTARKTVQLIVNASACNLLSAPLAMNLWAQFPHVSLSIQELPSKKILSQLSDSSAKIAVSADSISQLEALQITGDGYIFEPLYTDHFCLVVSTSSPYLERETVDVEEIMHEHLALAQFYPSANEMIVGNVLRKFPRYTRFSSYEQIKKTVAQSEMIAIMPRLALYNDVYLKQGLIQCLPISGFQTGLVYFLIHDTACEFDDIEQFLIDSIRTYFSGLTKLPPD